MKNVSIFGAGYWGGNLIRVFYELSSCKLHSVVDLDASRLDKLKIRYPDVQMYGDPKKVYDNPDIDAVVDTCIRRSCRPYDQRFIRPGLGPLQRF